MQNKFANHWLNILPLVVYIYMYILHLSISYQQTIHARSSPVECVCMLLFNLQTLIQYIYIYAYVYVLKMLNTHETMFVCQMTAFLYCIITDLLFEMLFLLQPQKRLSSVLTWQLQWGSPSHWGMRKRWHPVCPRR